MSQVSDEDIIKVLHGIVPEAPDVPARLASVHHRAKLRHRRHLAAGSLAVVGVVAVGAVIVNAEGSKSPASTPGSKSAAPATNPNGTKPATTKNGLPASLYRPLHLPVVAAGAACPVSPSKTYPSGGGFFGAFKAMSTGPVALADASPIPVNFSPQSDNSYAGTGWPGTKAIWRISPSYMGPVLFRGARLDGTGQLRFDHYLDAVGTTFTGSPDTNAYPDLGYAAEDGIKYVRTPPSGIRMQSPGCYGIQIDGTNFSEVITFKVIAAP